MTIKLITGDNLPVITLALKDLNSGSAIDLSGETVTVKVYFRSVDSKEIIATFQCDKANDGSEGKVFFSFGTTLENINPGLYEGEIEIDYDGQIQTVYEPLQFTVREQFA